MQWVAFNLFGVVVLLKLRKNAYNLLGKGIVSNISTLRGVLVGAVTIRTFYM